MISQYFSFRTAAGIVVDSPFSVRPIQFPTTSGSVIFTADPVYCLHSPQTLDLVSNTYDISLRGYSDNHFYIQTSGSVNETASYNLISGSQITSSISNVLFDWENIIGNPTEGITVSILPIARNISWEDSFVIHASIECVTDANGEFTTSLIQTEYAVIYEGLTKHTPLYLSISGSSATASQCIINEPYRSSKVVIPKQTYPYGNPPITSSNLYTPLHQTYFQEQQFQFALCTGEIISQNFQVIPMQPPWVSGSIIFSSDPLTFTSSTDPVSVLMATGLYKVELNKRASSDFWISLSGSVSSIAASNIVSGSYQVADYCQVLFNLADFECNPLSAVLTIKPIYVNVGINNTFLVEDQVSFTVTNGSKTVQLAPMPYDITIHSTGTGYGKKDGHFQIYPVNSTACTASQIIVQGYNKNKVAGFPFHTPLPFSVDFSSSYAVNALDSIHSIYSDSASYVSNSYPQLFDGSRPIKTLAYVGEIPGSTTISGWLDSVFYADILGTISINSGVSYVESGSAPTITINGALTLNDSIIAGSGSVWRDGVEWYPFTGTSYSTTDIGIVTDHSYETYYQLDTGIINSSTKTVDLIFPFLYGVSSTSGLSGTALYNALTLDVTPQANKTYTVSGTETYLYVAYPATVPDLTDAYDPNLFHILSTFDKSTVSVTSTGLATNWTANYKVYQWGMLADFSGNYQIVF